MNNKEELTLGENLKRLRKELGLRQHEIVGKELTRNLISMIENNKTPMYYRTAKLISENMNRISNERDLGIYVSPDDIMNPRRIQAKKKANRYIDELKKCIDIKNYDLSENYIKDIESFLKQWNIPEKKVAIYHLLGDISYYRRDTQEEYTYLTRALENYFINPIQKNIYRIVIKLMANCIVTNKHNEAIRLSNLDVVSLDKLPDMYKGSLVFNKALAYKKLERYEDSLEAIKELKGHLGEYNQEALKSSIMLEGVIYSSKGEYDKAINKFKEYIELCGDNHGQLGLAYSNIIDLYITTDEKEKLVEYRDKLISLLPKISEDDLRLLGMYYNIAEGSQYLKEYELAKTYFIKGFHQSIKDKETVIRPKIVTALLEIYMITDDKEEVFAKDGIMMEYIENVSLTNEMRGILKFISFSLEEKGKEDTKSLVSGLLG